jgi:hypothetical protein
MGFETIILTKMLQLLYNAAISYDKQGGHYKQTTYTFF